MATNELSPVTQMALAVAGTFTEREIEVIKTTICPGINDEQLDLFLAYCRRTGLDPIARQIYATLRTKKSKDAYGKWTESQALTIQTSIDGFRVIAERTGKYAGQTEPEWCGPDGVWKTVWLSKSYPSAARVGVYRKDFDYPIYAVATWDSYCQYVPLYENGQKSGQRVGDMWDKMPDLMISKCAEALALRKAMPNDLGGIYSADEMAQASNEPRRPRPAVLSHVDESTGEVLDAEYADDAPAPSHQARTASPPPARSQSTLTAEQQAGKSRDMKSMQDEGARVFGRGDAGRSHFTEWLGAEGIESLQSMTSRQFDESFPKLQGYSSYEPPATGHIGGIVSDGESTAQDAEPDDPFGDVADQMTSDRQMALS